MITISYRWWTDRRAPFGPGLWPGPRRQAPGQRRVVGASRVVPRSGMRSTIRPEGRTHTLSRPFPDLSPARILAASPLRRRGPGPGWTRARRAARRTWPR